MTFSETLQTLPAIDHLAGLQLRDPQGAVVATLDNRPGQAGSVAVYHALAQRHGTLNAAAALDGLTLYAEHTADAHTFPGKHPNIDRLVAIASGALPPLTVQPVPRAA